MTSTKTRSFIPAQITLMAALSIFPNALRVVVRGSEYTSPDGPNFLAKAVNPATHDPYSLEHSGEVDQSWVFERLEAIYWPTDNGIIVFEIDPDNSDYIRATAHSATSGELEVEQVHVHAYDMPGHALNEMAQRMYGPAIPPPANKPSRTTQIDSNLIMHVDLGGDVFITDTRTAERTGFDFNQFRQSGWWRKSPS